MSEDAKYYREVYLGEVREHIRSLNELFLHLEKKGADKPTINEAFRIMHSIKGDSAMMGLKKIADYAHEAEDLLAALRDGKGKVNKNMADRLLRYVDGIEEMINIFEEQGEAGLDKFSTGEKDCDADGSPKKLEERLKQDPPDCKADESIIDKAEGKTSEIGELSDALGPAPLSSSLPSQATDTELAYKIILTNNFDQSLKPMRAFMIMKILAECGDIISTDPSNEKLAVGDIGSEVTAVVITKDLEKLREDLSKIEGVTSVNLEEVQVDSAGSGNETGSLAALDKVSQIDKLIANVETQTKELSGITMSVDNDGQKSKHKLEEIKVNVTSLDRLFNLAGELVLAKSRMNNIVKVYDINELKEVQRFMDGVVSDLQTEVMNMRLMPIDQVFGIFPRMVRDMARSSGKEIDLVIEGGDTAVDRKILEEILDPVVHILRNCVDHGIETQEERTAAGKNAVGTIRIVAHRDSSHFILDVEDDGRGIDPKAVKEIALARGLINKKKAESVSDIDALNLICIPGFSTKKEVSDLSGRGVGMSAVKSKVEACGGTLKIKSSIGSGTMVSMRLPVSMATIKILVVRIMQQAYAIPVPDVSEIVEVGKDDIRFIQGEPFINLRGKIIKLHRLSDLLGFGEEEEFDSCSAVIIRKTDGTDYGLLVTEVMDEDEVAMKPVPKLFRGIRGLLGASILGDGKPTFIIDVLTLT